MDFGQIQHGNIQLGNLISNPEFSDFLGDEFKAQHIVHDPQQDAKLLVRFFSGAVLLSYASSQLRKPKVVQTDFISIRLDEYNEHITEVGYERDAYGNYTIIGGEKVPTPLREEYTSRFPLAWASYQKQFEDSIGTPLSQLRGITLSEIAELGIYKIGTIEALADAHDRLFISVRGSDPLLDVRENGKTYFELREQARNFIKENGQLEAIVKAKEAAEIENEQLKELVQKLKSELVPSSPTTQDHIDIQNEQAVLDERLLARAKAEKRK
jgi:hypothetical protein